MDVVGTMFFKEESYKIVSKSLICFFYCEYFIAMI